MDGSSTFSGQKKIESGQKNRLSYLRNKTQTISQNINDADLNI